MKEKISDIASDIGQVRNTLGLIVNYLDSMSLIDAKDEDKRRVAFEIHYSLFLGNGLNHMRESLIKINTVLDDRAYQLFDMSENGGGD